MSDGELATMVNGPWGWANLRKSGIDFHGAHQGGSPNADFAKDFLEKYVCTADGLKAIDADAPLGVPALKALAEEMSAKDPLIKGTYENALKGS